MTPFRDIAVNVTVDLVTQGLIVLGAILSLAAGFFLVRWAWRKTRSNMAGEAREYLRMKRSGM